MTPAILFQRRRFVNTLMSLLTCLCALAAVIPLFLILFHLFAKGFGSLNVHFFTELPKPVGEVGGGMSHALAGTGFLLFFACLIGFPIGILGGIYLAEFGNGKRGNVVRFAADVLNGTPSIVIGLFAYALIVLPMRNFSALAGGAALGIMMIPTLMRTTEEMMRLVPISLREAALGLGLPYWKMLIHIVLKTARPGILTGIFLAIARIAGETAPLLFTALGNQFWNFKITEPIAALPLQIYTFAISPFDDWQQQAWAGALVLIALVLTLNVGSRLLWKPRFKRRH